MNPDVLLLSSSFPYGTGEGFLAADLEALALAGLRHQDDLR